MMLEFRYNPFDTTSKVINVYEGCLRYLRYLREGRLKEKLEEIRKYFANSIDIIDLLIASEESRTYRYYVWMDKTGTDKRVDEMINELKSVKKIIDKIQEGSASEDEAKKAENVLDKIASYLLTKAYNELLREARKYVIGPV